jgi:hypothetical protein
VMRIYRSMFSVSGVPSVVVLFSIVVSFLGLVSFEGSFIEETYPDRKGFVLCEYLQIFLLHDK